MLQPLQLQDVSTRYREPVAELRDFLEKAGIAVGSSAAVAQVNERVRQDRAFHRDLTSHLWVLVEDDHASASTLLGVVALAAAGPALAAQVPGDDAHALLRFVMEARRAFEQPGVAAASARSSEHPEERNSAEHLVVASSGPATSQPVIDAVLLQPRSSVPAARRSRRTPWITAACILAAVLAAAWFWMKPKPQPVAPIVPGELATAPQPAATSPSAVTGGAVSNQPQVAASHPPRTAASTPRVILPASARHPSADSVPGVQPSTRTMAAENTPSIIASLGAAPTPTAKPSTPTASRATAPKAWQPVPAAVLSKRLDSPTLPAYAPAEDEATTRRHPRLLRRPTAAAGTLREQGDEIAEARPDDAPVVPTSGHNTATSGQARTGIVRPAALGTMAANVIYSPAPQYPPAATAANVQGEVRVQARIDPNGNVASARVISGPPLLRDAALEAVQHWRYRPWMASGRPTATSTVAVMDFELQ